MGRLIIPKTRDYLYKAFGTGLSPNINGLRFYDSGLIYNGKKSFYSENGQYAIWYNTIGVEAWYIGPIANIGTFTTNSWTKIGATDITTGSYPATFVSTTGTVTISEYKNKISIKKENLGGGKINLGNRVYVYKATGISAVPNIDNLRFYDSGLKNAVGIPRPIYYDETNTYKVYYSGANWVITLIAEIDKGYVAPIGIGNLIGTYTSYGGWSGTVTISAI